MKIGIITRNENSYSSTQLRRALARRGISYLCFSFPQLVARIRFQPYFRVGDFSLEEKLDALIIRPIGRGSLEQIVFRMDVLYRLQRLGLYVINPPEAIEHCVDKYDILAILEENRIPVPRTIVTESVDTALKAFSELGGDVIVKPLFGSRGIGATRISDPEIASSVFRAISFYHGVIYLQEFIHHGVTDIRAFIINNHVVAAMRRVSESWKANYSQGGRPMKIDLEAQIEDVSIRSAELIECKVAGVDILESSDGPVVVDVNSQPGWKGLQSVTKVDIADEIVDFLLSELKEEKQC